MKLAVVVAALIAMTQVRPAAACEPAYTCGDEFCRGPVAVVEATIAAIHSPDSTNGSSADVQVVAVYGDAGGITVGSQQNLRSALYYPFQGGDIGKTLVFGVTRDGAGGLQVESRTDLGDSFVTECFGAGATSATVAEIMLSPGCYATLVPDPVPNPTCPDGSVHCDAGGAHGSLWVVSAVGLVLRRRPRRKDARSTLTVSLQ